MNIESSLHLQMSHFRHRRSMERGDTPGGSGFGAGEASPWRMPARAGCDESQQGAGRQSPQDVGNQKDACGQYVRCNCYTVTGS